MPPLIEPGAGGPIPKKKPVIPAPVVPPVVQPPAQDPNAFFQTLIGMLGTTGGGGMYGASPTAQALQAPQFPMVAPDLSPEEVAYFDSLETRLNDQYGGAAANNLFQQGNLGIQHGITERDLNARFDQMREQLPGQYQKRGIMNSGIYGQGLSNYATQRTNATTDLAGQYQRGLTGLQNQYAQLGTTHTTNLGTTRAQRNARKNAVASTIRGIR